MRIFRNFLNTSTNFRSSSFFYKSVLPSPLYVKRNFISQTSIENILTRSYQEHIKSEDHFCLNQLEMDWVKRKPFSGQIVLVNMHITLITLTMIKILIKGGAKVEVTASPRLAVHENALSAIEEAKIPFYQKGDIPTEKQNKYFHVVFDCGGYMIDKIRPIYGMAELTHTDEKLYLKSPFPIITVDKSKVKEIETGFGTGDALVRVLINLAKKSIAMTVLGFINLSQQQPKILNSSYNHHLMSLMGLIDVNHIFKAQKYLIFGYGKVGKGIASALTSAGAKKENIFIIDVSPEAYMRIMEDGYQGFLLDKSQPDTLEKSIMKIKMSLNTIYSAITATGVQNAVSQHFNTEDFRNVPLLINMGTPDEWGINFSDDRIVYKKIAANFMLEYPTEVPYLDPIFSILLKSGEELRNLGLTPGLHTISEKIDKSVLSTWMRQHGDKVWQHTKTKDTVDSLLDCIKHNPEMNLKEAKDILGRYGIFNIKNSITPLTCFTSEESHDGEELGNGIEKNGSENRLK